MPPDIYIDHNPSDRSFFVGTNIYANALYARIADQIRFCLNIGTITGITTWRPVT